MTDNRRPQGHVDPRRTLQPTGDDRHTADTVADRMAAQHGMVPRTEESSSQAITRDEQRELIEFVRAAKHRSGQYRKKLDSVTEDAEELRSKLAEATKGAAAEATNVIQQAGVDVSAQMQKDALAAAATLQRWWKVALPAMAVVVALGASCGSAVFGYVSASRAAADQTVGVAEKAAEKAVAEAPKAIPAPVVTERIYYLPPGMVVPTPPAIDAGSGDN